MVSIENEAEDARLLETGGAQVGNSSLLLYPIVVDDVRHPRCAQIVSLALTYYCQCLHILS